MDVYLPIANLSVNGLIIVALGVLTGVLSGLFGVGGGFLTTPLLIFYGVPPTVAAASLGLLWSLLGGGVRTLVFLATPPSKRFGETASSWWRVL